MTLRQMSEDYRDAAVRLRNKLQQLRIALKTEQDPQMLFEHRRKIAALTPVLTELNELAQLTAHYYDRGYYRDEKYTMQRISGPAVAKRKPGASHSLRYE